MLVESGAIKPERLTEAVLEVQKRILCKILLWRKGTFAFHLGTRATDEDIALDLDRLIIEGLRLAQAPDDPIRREEAA